MKPTSVVSFRDLNEGFVVVNKSLSLPFYNVISPPSLLKTIWNLSVFKYLTGPEVIANKPSYISRRFRHTLKVTN